MRGLLDRDPGDLGRRVRPPLWPDRRVRRGDRAVTTTATASRCGWPAAGFKGGHERRGDGRAGQPPRSPSRLHVKRLHATVLQQMGLDPNPPELLLWRARVEAGRRRGRAECRSNETHCPPEPAPPDNAKRPRDLSCSSARWRCSPPHGCSRFVRRPGLAPPSGLADDKPAYRVLAVDRRPVAIVKCPRARSKMERMLPFASTICSRRLLAARTATSSSPQAPYDHRPDDARQEGGLAVQPAKPRTAGALVEIHAFQRLEDGPP